MTPRNFAAVPDWYLLALSCAVWFAATVWMLTVIAESLFAEWTAFSLGAGSVTLLAP